MININRDEEQRIKTKVKGSEGKEQNCVRKPMHYIGDLNLKLTFIRKRNAFPENN